MPNIKLVDAFTDFVEESTLPYRQMMTYYNCALMEVETKFKVLNEQFSLFYDRNPIESIHTRIKSQSSILKKLQKKNLALTIPNIENNLFDIAGVRVVCSFTEDIYSLANSFLNQDDVRLIEKKDYIENPKENGYRSLHLIVEIPIFLSDEKKWVKVEVQFRTIAMDFWASLEHKIRYKKNHITFISLTQSELSSDFKLIDKQLRHENKYDIHYILLMFEKNLLGDFKYFLNCLKQLVEIKKSSLVILNDNNYVISHMKPKNVKVLQIWHACGAVKKFGNQIKRQYPVQNYDYVLCNAEYWKDPYSQAFNVEKDQVLVTGMPRIDTLLNLNGKDEFYLKYPELKDKKLCLYAPTFRGNIIDGFKIQSFDFTKIKDYIVLYKFHPLLGDIQCKGGINMNKEDLYTLMQVSDCLISDYSSVIFDYSLLNKPMISYIPDIDEYKQDIGLNIDFNDFPGPVCTDEDQLMEALKFEDYDYDKLSYFQMKYMVYTDGRNTSRVVDTINQIMEEA
jgi:CDP-ribitol ribitolphosphotransferase / teichoic acid ribitol-phosphate polymerase